jgi:hypothetical protein
MDHVASREGPNSVRVHKYLPYLVHQYGYQILKVALQRCIQSKMYFLDISSLRVAYRYVVKIEHKFKHQNKKEFGSVNPQQPKYGKGIPNPHNSQPQENHSKMQENKSSGKIKKDTGKWCDFQKIIGTTPMSVAENNHFYFISKKQNRASNQTLIQTIIKGDR